MGGGGGAPSIFQGGGGPLLALERQKCVNLRKIRPSRGLLDFQRGGFDKGEVKNSGGLRPPLELCFGTSEIK